MAGHQLIAPMPSVTLDSGCTVTWEAIDPATGADVAGVVISQAALYGVNEAPPGAKPPPGEDVLPYFAPIPAAELV